MDRCQINILKHILILSVYDEPRKRNEQVTSEVLQTPCPRTCATYPAPTLSTWSSQDGFFSLPSCISSFPGSDFFLRDFLQEDCNSVSRFRCPRASRTRLPSQKPADAPSAPFLLLVLSSPGLLAQVCLPLQIHVSRFPQRQGKEQTA